MTETDPRLQQVIDLIDHGDKLQARTLLTQLIKEDKYNPDYWLWMSGVVGTVNERIFCLKEVLKLDPENKSARFGLQMVGELPKDPGLAVPYEQQKRNWQKLFEPPPPPPKPKKKVVGKVLAFIGMLAVLGTAGYFLVTSTIGSFRAAPTLRSIMGATATASATPSPGPHEYTPTPSGPQPLWMQLKATYTPTPLYMATDHPLLEAYSTGMRAYLRGDWPNVINYMQQVIDAEKNAIDAEYLIGEAYRFMGQHGKALETFNDIIKKDPAYAPAFLGRARTRLAGNIGKWQLAQTDLEEAIRLDPNLGEAYLELGGLLAMHDSPEEALELLDTAGMLLPESPQVYFYQGMAYLDLNNTTAALKAAKKANDLDVTYLPSYYLLGMAYQAEGRIAASLSSLETYVAYEKNDAEAFALLGVAYGASGDDERALEAFARAIQLDAQSTDSYLQRGTLYLRLENGEKALADFQKAWSFNTRSYAANMGIGRAYYILNQYGNAYIQFSKTESLADEDSQKAGLYYWRALSLEGLEENSAAILDWQRMLKLPEDVITAAQKATAEEHIALLNQPTETATGTPTKTLTPTRTPLPGKESPTPAVPTGTQTPTPTVTPTVKTPTPTRTLTVTKTR